MRKRRFVCGIALCLALSVAGCGKSSEEKQAAKYYQDQLGLDKKDAESLAHEVYGKDEEDPGTGVPDEGSQKSEVEPLPELVNSEWYDRKVQICDMVFSFDPGMTEEEIRKIVEGSAYDVELQESFDDNGEVCLQYLVVNGEVDAIFKKRKYSSEETAKYGLPNEGDYYSILYGTYCAMRRIDNKLENGWYDKASVEFSDLKTREDVLTYLADNGFVEVEEEQATYGKYYRDGRIGPDETSVEFADVPHYYCKGARSITLYRIHKLNETNQEIQYDGRRYSGAHVNLVNFVTFEFNTDGTIAYSNWENYNYTNYNIALYSPGLYELVSHISTYEILGEKIN